MGLQAHCRSYKLRRHSASTADRGRDQMEKEKVQEWQREAESGRERISSVKLT